ncbi:AfsA-related hotdog domain-containing protein [Kitasatospora sp. NPDC088134]|uniref:AfsA-related hotdog domain-containing protein n=1 Tax=Kitasatospora sp. NPDC088134 TaxID=3364071 RepID=UPI003804F40A
MNPPLVVVGDRFEEFLALPGAIGATDLLERLRTWSAADGDTPYAVTVGQGLTAGQLAELRAAAGAADGRLAVGPDGVPEPSERTVTHKAFDKNVLIGAVERLGPEHYRTPLVLDERVEVLEDHLTGLHIPAVTLLEAARQTWTAVTEQFLVPAEPATRFVIGHVDSTFESLVFPLPAHLEYRLTDQRATATGQSLSFTVTVHQTGRTAARFAAQIHSIQRLFAVKQEHMAARQELRTVLTAHRTAEPPVPALAATAGA